MNKIDSIIIHCSATKEGVNFKAKDIDRMHKQRGFNQIGYHYIIDLILLYLVVLKMQEIEYLKYQMPCYYSVLVEIILFASSSIFLHSLLKSIPF